MFKERNLDLSCILASLPCKFNLGNCHYITSKGIATISNLICIERYITNITCNFKNKCKKI